MNRSKVYSASCFAYALFSYLELANLGGSGCIFVTALNHPAVKEGHNDVFHSTKSQAISKWRANNLRSASASASESEIQVIDPSELQGKNETNNNMVSDHTENSADLRAPRPRKVLGYGFSPLAELVLLQRRFFNRLDAMDKMIVRNTLPLVGLVALVPLLQSADLFWVNQLGDTLAVSAQSAANTLYQFSFGLISFLPSVTATLVSKNFANNDIERTESTINTALLFGLTTSSIIAMTLFANPGRYLGAVLKGTTCLKKAKGIDNERYIDPIALLCDEEILHPLPQLNFHLSSTMCRWKPSSCLIREIYENTLSLIDPPDGFICLFCCLSWHARYVIDSSLFY
jgi:hypothetical protein